MVLTAQCIRMPENIIRKVVLWPCRFEGKGGGGGAQHFMA